MGPPLLAPGDPYATESILVHEFGHTIHELALNVLDPDFQRRLQECYDRAKQKGLWQNTYAVTSVGDYWAEGIQDWFDTNRPPDKYHVAQPRAAVPRGTPALGRANAARGTPGL